MLLAFFIFLAILSGRRNWICLSRQGTSIALAHLRMYPFYGSLDTISFSLYWEGSSKAKLELKWQIGGGDMEG